MIDYKWIFKTKYKSNGSLDRNKACLVAKEFQQHYGVNVGETFSLVAKSNTIRVLLTIVISLNLTVSQLDMNNTFLNGYLNEVVFMSQPEGFID